MREDVDSLLFDLDGDPTPAQVARLKELDGKLHRICGSEPNCRKSVIDRHYAEEKKGRQPVPMQAAC
jgi:hypothetical protein